MSTVFNDQDNKFDKNNLTSDNELANWKYNDISLGESTLLEIFWTLQNYVSKSNGNNVFSILRNMRINFFYTEPTPKW